MQSLFDVHWICQQQGHKTVSVFCSFCSCVKCVSYAMYCVHCNGHNLMFSPFQWTLLPGTLFKGVAQSVGLPDALDDEAEIKHSVQHLTWLCKWLTTVEIVQTPCKESCSSKCWESCDHHRWHRYRRQHQWCCASSSTCCAWQTCIACWWIWFVLSYTNVSSQVPVMYIVYTCKCTCEWYSCVWIFIQFHATLHVRLTYMHSGVMHLYSVCECVTHINIHFASHPVSYMCFPS